MSFLRKIAFLLLVFANTVFSYEYQITVLAMFRDEADWLKEWIDYHLRIGVDHFLLYDNRSTDNYREVLQPYIDAGIIEIKYWNATNFPAFQFDIYRDGITYMKGKTKWMALIDTDEFINPKVDDSLGDFLDEYEDYAGVVMNWIIFGTSNVYKLRDNQSMLKKLTLRLPLNYDEGVISNFWVKSIIRPDRVDEFSSHPQCGNHVFMPISGYSMVDQLYCTIPLNPHQKRVLSDKIQLNHYWFRTRQWFNDVKLARRRSMGEVYKGDYIQKIVKDANNEEDLSIQRFVP